MQLFQLLAHTLSGVLQCERQVSDDPLLLSDASFRSWIVSCWVRISSLWLRIIRLNPANSVRQSPRGCDTCLSVAPPWPPSLISFLASVVQPLSFAGVAFVAVRVAYRPFRLDSFPESSIFRFTTRRPIGVRLPRDPPRSPHLRPGSSCELTHNNTLLSDRDSNGILEIFVGTILPRWRKLRGGQNERH